ncbi:ATP-binding cassette domain-containing protein [Microbacterium horticulturae]|uniref:ATP-binding cassette domain-containing protein n=1 Tax=Microbacterium horticulturae TaxID=3028316 RepID=A0ABY8C1Q9_9MICO|nr:ATP-binding cassette domain-containing protein [Microbacterium sp. KACC 23027]WEG10386.1 ATP-binding cassette domain-containing protein [Microbacterium sp. KACC 23027]
MARHRDTDVAIECVDLSIARASARGGDLARVVDGVSARLPHAGALAVLGPTGAGKSSLAAVLAGAEEPGLAVVGGDAWVEGIPVRKPGRAHRLHTYVTGYLAQGDGSRLPSRLTVEEVISSPITRRSRRADKRALAIRVAALLDEMKLPLGIAVKYPYELSAGMRQRVAFARAVMLQPRVLIADDLLANLDLSAREAVLAAIRRRRDAYGMSTLLVGNDRDSVEALNARVLVLRAGHVVAVGESAADVTWTPSGEADHRLIAS